MYVLFMADSRDDDMEAFDQFKIIYLILMAGFFFLDMKLYRTKNPVIWSFLAFFAVAVFAITKSPVKAVAIQKTFAYVLLFICMPPYFIRLMEDEKEKFLKGIVYMGTILLWLGMLWIFIDRNQVFLLQRYCGLLGNPNGLGIFCTVFFIIFSLIKTSNPNYFSKLDVIMVYLGILLSIVLSGSRNTMVSIFIFLLFSRFYKISPWFGFLALVITAFSYQLIEHNLVDILETLGLSQYARAETIASGSGRTIAWAWAWEEIREAYMWGKGFSYDEHTFEVNQDWLNDLGHQGAVHNTYLALWLNTGIIGLIFWLFGFIKNFITASKNSHFALPVMYALMFSITFESWLMSSLNAFTIYYLLIITFLLKIEPVAEEEKKYYEPEKSAVPVL
jgi:O-antigen ligase